MKAIPYSRQNIDSVDIKEVVKVLESDWITQGPKIKEFEEGLCKYTGAKFAVVVSNGTAALHIACIAAGIESGCEVITSALTFVASANCVLYCGGKPIFVDIQKDTANIDPENLKYAINKKTKAIIPVHFAGHPCDLEDIYKISKKNKLLIIEDAAHALGAKYKNSKIGFCRFSDITIFSFHPVKSISTGEGGAVLTNNKKIYKNLLLLRNHGISKKDFKRKLCVGSWYYEMQALGFNYRITDIQCALGISQLKKIQKFIERRRQVAEIYNNAFQDNGIFDLPIEKPYAMSSWHLYPIRLKRYFKKNRLKFFNSMRKNGLGVQVHYIPVYWHPYYRHLGYKRGSCPRAEDYYKSAISLPLYPKMSDKNAYRVINIVRKCLRGLL